MNVLYGFYEEGKYDNDVVLFRIEGEANDLMVDKLREIFYMQVNIDQLSRIVRKPDFCLGENKGADQLRGNREADQRLCFRCTDSTIPLLLKSEISSF